MDEELKENFLRAWMSTMHSVQIYSQKAIHLKRLWK